MNNTNSDISFDGIHQVGIVVKDIQKTISFFSSTFGLGPFRVYEQYQPDLIVHGNISPSKTKFALTRVGNIQMEFIQNIEGENIYTEFIRNTGEGLHHIAMRVDDADREIAKWERNGFTALQKGRAGGISWAYFEPQDAGGLIIEIIPRPPQK